jgi:hypothetical protein
MSGIRILNVGDPQLQSDGANMRYVDVSIAKLSYRNYCDAATTGNLDAKYDNGDHGIGAILSANNVGDLIVDDISGFVPNQRILVKN